ncbi:MAG: LPS export ABC transporter ATP-binding protein [Alphaproteobacteria bacterium]
MTKKIEEKNSKHQGLIATNLSRTFGKRQVVRDVSVRLNRGEVVGILGPNGAGKTTSFYMIVGLLKPTLGNIFLDDMDVTNIPMYQRARLGIGYLPQEASIFRGLNVEQNIMASLELHIADKQQRNERLDELLEEFGIAKLRKSSAISLSGGERRRVEIARALASSPDFILLDEPFAGVDPIAVQDLRKLVHHLKDRGIGVLITDHNVHETLEVIDRGYIIHTGQVIMEGTSQEITQDEKVRKVYLGDSFSSNY